MTPKLDRIRNGTYRPADFVMADANDGDMPMGAAIPGFRSGYGRQPTEVPRPLSDYRPVGAPAVARRSAAAGRWSS